MTAFDPSLAKGRSFKPTDLGLKHLKHNLPEKNFASYKVVGGPKQDRYFETNLSKEYRFKATPFHNNYVN